MGPFKINLHIHLNELKLRLFYTQLVWLTLLFLSYNYKETLLYLLIKQSIFQRQANLPYFIYTDITEVFYSYLNICIFTSTYLILPLISFQIWKFVKPGLYLTEEQFWRKFLTVLSVTWITSNFLIYYKLIPCI
jgi:sec-independent protein translocase protein TatC